MEFGFIDHPLAGTPIGAALDLCIVLAALAWLLSVVTHDYSWVDRLWSICPVLYCLIVAASLDFEAPRVNLMTALAGLWGVRLTFNLARKGGYWPGSEDYRWTVLRQRHGPLRFQLLNITFIAPGQMAIVWLFASPVHRAWLHPEAALGLLDWLAAALFLVFLAAETVADEQMWAFQQGKKRRMAAGEAISRPFLTSGLYRYCRHPNYAGDIGLWWVFYLFGVAASGEWVHWSGLGFIALTLVFVGSIALTESISAAKYPDYRAYQAKTPALIPFLRFAGSGRGS